MTHTISPFDDENGYRGSACSCGFTSSTGLPDADSANCKHHVMDEARRCEVTAFAEMMRSIRYAPNDAEEIHKLRGAWINTIEQVQRLI